jgi:hypothetical protein
MSTPWESPIIRVTTGRLNTVNDTVIGGSASIGSRSRYAGMLGKHLWLAPEQMGSMYDSGVGTLYGGRFRYVRMRAGDADSPALVVGQVLFWDTTITSWQTRYQVTRDADLSSVDNAMLTAGIFLGTLGPGNYGFIQDLGMVPIRFRGTLSTAGAVGSRVYVADSAGADEGDADVLTTDATSVVHARYLGVAVTAPAANTTSPVLLDFHNALGMVP